MEQTQTKAPVGTDEWLVEATIQEMQDAMAAGELTSAQLVLLYLDRIARFDKEGPKLNSVLEINPDALFLAEALDHERQASGARGPLHGIPVLVKDNVDTADKMHTSAGSLALANNYAAEDSFVAQQLRAAGAVILGKANMTEWANFMTINMPNGFSSRGGQVLNPYGPGTFDVGGSSSGSGSSIAANLAAVAVGTETSGSILSPANRNSLVGIKPTVGLVSRTGIIPIAFSQDTAGPLARTVSDAAILLGALTGVDERDPATLSSTGRHLTDYTTCLDADGLKGARIGIARDFFVEEIVDDQLALMNAAIEVLKQAGAEVIDPISIASVKEVDESFEVLVYEFKPALNAYLSKVAPTVPVHSLADVIEFNRAHFEKALKHDQTTLRASEETSGTLTEPEYIRQRALDIEWTRTKGIDATMKEHNLDAIFFPSYYGCAVAAKAGYPSVTVPAGYTAEGLPVGITFTGMAYSEPTLIKLAYAYEQLTKHRVAPKL